jgi:hypothetical protein
MKNSRKLKILIIIYIKIFKNHRLKLKENTNYIAKINIKYNY